MSDAHPTTGMPTTLRGSAVLFLGLAGLGATAGTVLGFFGNLVWFLDLFAHFRFQYAVVLLAAALGLGLLRRRIAAGVFGGALVVNVVMVLPMWIGSNAHAIPPGQTQGQVASFRLVAFNVLTSNRQHDTVIDWLLAEDADVLVLQELNRAWFESLEAGLTGYHSLDASAIREDNFGLSVYVREGIRASGRVVYLDGVGGPVDRAEAGYGFRGVPSLDVELEIGGQAVRVLAVHTLPPVSAEYDTLRRRQLEAAGELAAESAVPTLIAGDLNATPWSAPFQRLLLETDLRDSAEGFGHEGTWPSGLAWTGMIPIDHVLVGPAFEVVDRRVGPHLGSDHRAVVVDLELATSLTTAPKH